MLDMLLELTPAIEASDIKWDSRIQLRRPGTEAGAVLLGYTDQVRNDAQRKRNGQVFREEAGRDGGSFVVWICSVLFCAKFHVFPLWMNM